MSATQRLRFDRRAVCTVYNSQAEMRIANNFGNNAESAPNKAEISVRLRVLQDLKTPLRKH